ncbi:ParM/StbA family protein [Clostridium sporogenes]|uniref:ParM/StbA family protein n=1 Tax=Clostridium sporogenes TaxID=1509 RepID=UPI000668E178|nr:ParM/StbA family protein [Clostridium sporogenes]
MGKDVQIIGIDLGRGYTKAYSEHNELKKQCLFKSVIGIGRNIDFSNYDRPIYIEVNNQDYFAGILAEEEGYTPTRNSKDSKTTSTVEKLLYAALNEVAVEDEVKLMIGVPYKTFRKSTLNEIENKYKDKKVKIKDKINGGYKDINIVDVKIFREGDAALMWEVREQKENQQPIGMVTIGFRTTELSYFDKGLKFNDKLSKTIDNLGNRTALEYVQNELETKNISKDLNVIDSSTDYDIMKKNAYQVLSERISQEVEDNWINLAEMNIYIAGGTALNMEFDKQFKLVDDPQMATAKGLFLVGTRVFK